MGFAKQRRILFHATKTSQFQVNFYVQDHSNKLLNMVANDKLGIENNPLLNS